MNFRLTAILFGTILVIGVVLLIFTFSGDGKTVPTDALMEELAGVKPEDIDTVDLEREDGAKLKLVRVGKDQWNVEWDATNSTSGKEPVKAKADSGAINSLIASLLKAKPTTHPELSTNPARHGLQPPGLKVTFRQGSERWSTINFGDVTIGGAKAVAFVTTSSRPDRPMATPRASVEALFRTPDSGKAVDIAKWAPDFRAKGVFADAPTTDQVSSVSLTAKGKTLALTRSGAGWKFVSPAGWGEADVIGEISAPGKLTGVSQLLGTLTNLQAMSPGDFVEAPTPQQLVEFGLNTNSPDLVRVEIKSRNGETTVAYIGKSDLTAAPSAPGMPAMPSGKVWVRVEGQPGVIRASGGDLSGLVAVIENPDPLRDRTLLAIDKPRIDGIDIVTTGARLRRVGMRQEWKLFGPPTPNEQQPTNDQLVNQLLGLLTERRTIKSFPPTNDANFAPEVRQLEVRVWSDAFEPQSPTDAKAEPKQKDKVQPTTLIFGKSEGESVYVRRILPDGAKADFLLPEKVKLGSGAPVDLVSSLRKTRLELLDTTLKTFSPDVVSKITVSGVKNYELDKDAKPDSSTNKDRWIFAGPADKKGQTADSDTVAEMLRILGTTQSASRFVNEAPDDAALIEYGLMPPKMPGKDEPPAPRLKVAIGLKDAPATDKQRDYEFGKEKDGYVYARQAGKTAVFAVPKLVYEKFAASDLRDRAIFRFDPAQVTGVEIKGWGKQGAVVELNFEKNKDGVWTVSKSSIGMYNLDPNKVTAFLNMLSKAQVKTFLSGELPEQGFKDTKENLNIVFRIKDHPGISLNLGALTADKSAFYGSLTTLAQPPAVPPPPTVFTVDAAPFQMYKDGSGVFAR